MTLFNHDLVPNAPAGRVELYAMLLCELLDQTVLFQVLLILVLDVVI